MTDSTWRQILHDSGAVFVEPLPPFAPTAAHFGDPQREYNAAKSDVAVFDVSDRTQIEITGADRATFLHNFCTNDIKKLQPGDGCEAFVTNIKAHVLAHIFVFAGPESLWIDSVPGSEEKLIAHLDRFLITEDVQLHGRSTAFAELFLTGPKSAESVSSLGRDSVSIRPVDWFGTSGFLLSVWRDDLPKLWRAVGDTGATPGGSHAFHTLRMESRFPWYGIDITEDNLAQEVARTETAISFTKGCYLGQEPIARIDAMGHVNRQLCAMTCEVSSPPPSGAAIIDPGDDSRKEIGRITSTAQLTVDQAPVALAYLRSKFAKPGTRVLIVFDGSENLATVSSA